MRIKWIIRIGLAALFITLGIILVSSCGGSFTISFVDTLRPPAKAPEKQTPPKTVEKEEPKAPAEEPKTDIAVSEEPKATEEPEESAVVSEETEQAEGAVGQPTEVEDSAAKKPSATQEQEQKEEATAPVEKKPEQTPEKVKQNEQKQKTETVKAEEEKAAEKGEEQKTAKERTKPPETKENAVSIAGVVSLRKNTFYITELESEKRYKLVGLKKEEEEILRKLIGKQANFELAIVSTEAKKAYNAQLVKILDEKEETKGQTEETVQKKEKKK